MDFFREVIAPALGEGADVEAIKSKFEAFKNEQLSGVIQNKEKILDEKKALQKELEDVKASIKGFQDADITLEKYQELEVELEALKKNVSNPDELKEKETLLLDRGKILKEKELTPIIDKLTVDFDGASKQLEEYKAKYQKYMVQNQVTKMLNDLHVQYDDIWLGGFMNKAKIEYDESSDTFDINLYLQDQNTTVPIADWKKVWPTTEHGKRMIKAPANYGGGAGGSGNGPAKDMKDTLSGMFAYKN